MSEENEMTDITTTGFVPIDFTRLPKLEAVIKRGLSTFLQVGRALLEIHDGRLYAAEHRTFEEYCSKRWKLSVQRGLSTHRRRQGDRRRLYHGRDRAAAI
jgi:hypothetical protein